MEELLRIVTLGPKAAIGSAEVPSPGTIGRVIPMFATSLGVAVDLAFILASGNGMASFPSDPASLGEIFDTSSF